MQQRTIPNVLVGGGNGHTGREILCEMSVLSTLLGTAARESRTRTGSAEIAPALNLSANQS